MHLYVSYLHVSNAALVFAKGNVPHGRIGSQKHAFPDANISIMPLPLFSADMMVGCYISLTVVPASISCMVFWGNKNSWVCWPKSACAWVTSLGSLSRHKASAKSLRNDKPLCQAHGLQISWKMLKDHLKKLPWKSLKNQWKLLV